MSNADRVNRELSRLDTELRAGGIDRATFRAHRRRILLDFEERQTTTTPGAAAGSSDTTEPGAPEPSVIPSAPIATARKRPALGIAALGIGALVVALVVGWWMARSRTDDGATGAGAPVVAAGKTPATAGAGSPQEVASFLLGTEWTDADVAEFLRRWSELTPESIQAASQDPKIWLLRGETGRRLREAREAESVEHSSEMLVRVQQLEQIEAALRTP